MKLIVAVDENWAIGYRGATLFDLPKDLHFFRDTTIGHVVVMGRSTLQTLPNGNPLPKRDNIVLSNYPNLEHGTAIVTSLPKLEEVLAPYQKEGKEVFVIGGGSVYRQLHPYCEEAIVTFIQEKAERVDTFFPNLEQEEWELVHESEPMEENNVVYTYRYYKNPSPQPLHALT